MHCQPPHRSLFRRIGSRILERARRAHLAGEPLRLASQRVPDRPRHGVRDPLPPVAENPPEKPISPVIGAACVSGETRDAEQRAISKARGRVFASIFYFSDL